MKDYIKHSNLLLYMSFNKINEYQFFKLSKNNSMKYLNKLENECLLLPLPSPIPQRWLSLYFLSLLLSGPAVLGAE